MFSKHEFEKFKKEYEKILGLPLFDKCKKEMNPNKLYHYTNLDVAYKILENDEMWAGNIRFSNDLSEGRANGFVHSLDKLNIDN